MAIFMGVILGFGLIKYRYILAEHWHRRKYLFLAGHIIILAYTIFYVFINTVFFVYLKYGYLYPALGSDNFELFDHFLL